MNIQTIRDLCQVLAFTAIITMNLIQAKQIRELEENAWEMTKAIISTRHELDLPVFPPEPVTEDEV